MQVFLDKFINELIVKPDKVLLMLHGMKIDPYYKLLQQYKDLIEKEFLGIALPNRTMTIIDESEFKTIECGVGSNYLVCFERNVEVMHQLFKIFKNTHIAGFKKRYAKSINNYFKNLWKWFKSCDSLDYRKTPSKELKQYKGGFSMKINSLITKLELLRN